MSVQNPKQTTLIKIAADLRAFDFKNYNAITDKKKLMDVLTVINGDLGKLLQLKGIK